MAKVESKNKQNPKLVQSELQDGRASLALEYYLGRNETPVLYEDGSHVLYTERAMKGKPKYKIRHIRKGAEPIHMAAPSQPAGTQPEQKYSRSRRKDKV